ncbi:MAG TPA: hypothetical protein VIK86_00235 [Candidatus Paceibacterota bacterium]
MDDKKLLEKFVTDVFKIEGKLIKVRLLEEGNSYRSLTALYIDSLRNIETYNNKNYDNVYFENFYTERKNTISDELIELEKISNRLLDNDNFREYKVFNQSFQDLARVQSNVNSLIIQYKDKNEYDKLLNYRNEEAFINKDKLIGLLKNKTSLNFFDTISIEISRAEGKELANCTITKMSKDKNNLIIDNISDLTFTNIKEIYEHIKTYYVGINKIIVNTNGIGRSLSDYINEDEELKDKLVQNISIDKVNRSKSIVRFKDDVSLNNITFRRTSCSPMYPSRINPRILQFFNDIQNLKLELNNGVAKLVNINDEKEQSKSLNCILNYYIYLNQIENYE